MFARFVGGAVGATMLLAGTALAQTTTLKASHQFPAGDVRDEMVQIIKKEVENANVGLEVQVYPGASLFKPREQWRGLTTGQLDISSFPLDYASGQVPQFSATLMPGLVGSHERAQRLNDSPFMEEIKRLIEENDVIVLSDAWLGGAFASKTTCITSPDTIQGQTTRAAGPAFEEMLAAAGASIASMPSSEIYQAMQTGVLDAANTSSESFVSYRLYEQVKCLTAPGANALWFMYEPILMSKESFDKLTPEQQQALMDAGQKAEDFFNEQSAQIDQQMADKFKEAGVEVTEMSDDDYEKWLEVAKESSYKTFAEQVPGGDKLIEQALAVE